VDARAVYTHNLPIRQAFRGYGLGQVQFGIECALDELARKLGLEPVELPDGGTWSAPGIAVVVADRCTPDDDHGVRAATGGTSAWTSWIPRCTGPSPIRVAPWADRHRDGRPR